MYSRKPTDGAIAYNTRYELGYMDACFFGRGRSIRKRLRAQGLTSETMRQAEQGGDDSHLFEFEYKVTLPRGPEKRWAVIRGIVHASYIHLFCEGPQADEIVAKVNAALYPWLRTPQDDMRARRALERKEALAKRRRRRCKMHRPRPDRVKADNDNKVFVPAPIAAKKKERLTPQFRNTSVSWHEAVRSVVFVFDVKPTLLFTAYELAETRLRRSLEREKVQFAHWKHGGFTLRFDTFDGVWRGDSTELMVSCTKDTRHELYRRARKYFASILIGFSLERQLQRRARLTPANLLETTAISASIAA